MNAAGPYFVACETRGVFGRMFTDFGDAFCVHDTDGEPPRTALISSIIKACVLLYRCALKFYVIV